MTERDGKPGHISSFLCSTITYYTAHIARYGLANEQQAEEMFASIILSARSFQSTKKLSFQQK